MQAMGSLLLWISLHPGFREVDDFRKELRQISDEITLPALELFSEGLFVDRQMLDDYLMYVCDPPAGDADTVSRPRASVGGAAAQTTSRRDESRISV